MKLKDINNLPPELLQRILDLLEQDDQLQCMLACRLWKNIIQEFCLFRTISIYSPGMLNGISKTTQEHPSLLNNVEKLTLHSYRADEKTWFSLLESLPNIRDFYYIGPLFEELISDDIPKLPWCNSIEKIIVDSCHRIVDNLIFNSMCPNLTDLNIQCTENMSLEFLNNTPALKSLILCTEPIEFDEIDKIHEILPNLKALGLRNKAIMGDVPKGNVIPAYSITRLILNLIEIPNLVMELELLRYIVKKYPNLEELIFETQFCTEDNDEKNTLHGAGWNPLFKNVAPTLRTLHTTYTGKIQNLLETLDEHKCQIENLKMESLVEIQLPSFSLSQQALYIRTLILKNIKVESYEWLEDMEILENLELRFNRYENYAIKFNDIIDYAPPTLMSLTFFKVHLKLNLKSVIQSNIDTLVFERSNLPDNLVKFIDRNFPQLTNLTLNRCVHFIKEITLRSVELNSFHYVIGGYATEANVLVRTIYNGDERLYSTRGELHQIGYESYYEEYNGVIHPPAKSQPADNIKIKPDISLVCFKVANVILHL